MAWSWYKKTWENPFDPNAIDHDNEDDENNDDGNNDDGNDDGGNDGNSNPNLNNGNNKNSNLSQTPINNNYYNPIYNAIRQLGLTNFYKNSNSHTNDIMHELMTEIAKSPCKNMQKIKHGLINIMQT